MGITIEEFNFSLDTLGRDLEIEFFYPDENGNKVKAERIEIAVIRCLTFNEGNTQTRIEVSII